MSTQYIFWPLAFLIAAQPSQQKPNEASWTDWKCEKVEIDKNFFLCEKKLYDVIMIINTKPYAEFIRKQFRIKRNVIFGHKLKLGVDSLCKQ